MSLRLFYAPVVSSPKQTTRVRLFVVRLCLTGVRVTCAAASGVSVGCLNPYFPPVKINLFRAVAISGGTSVRSGFGKFPGEKCGDRSDIYE